MMPPVEELQRDFICMEQGAPVVSWAPDCLSSLGSAVAVIGAFDGVHRGHRALIAAACADARTQGMRTVAVTFNPDPDVVVSPNPALKLTSHEDRVRLLASSGVDAVLEIPFTRELSQLDHAAFFLDVLFRACDVRSIHVGSDFRLGRNGASNVPIMREWCAARGIAFVGHDLLQEEGEVVSATHIRHHLAQGELKQANRELGRRYLLRGQVHTGRGEGTGMGFPTANIAFDASLQTPAEGVYSGLALVDGFVWPAAINVGIPPTFADRAASASMEANLIGFSGNIYGDAISLVFAERLRGLVKFPSQEELVRTVLDNIDTVKRGFGEAGVKLA